jgi:hypothetical protein
VRSWRTQSQPHFELDLEASALLLSAFVGVYLDGLPFPAVLTLLLSALDLVDLIFAIFYFTRGVGHEYGHISQAQISYP